jgi:CHAD domain-containing protein
MKDGRRAMDDPTPERLHTLRISAKRTRYLLEFFKEMTGRPGQRLTRTLVALQDTLGMQHDAVVAVSTAAEVMHQRTSSRARSGLTGLRAFAAAQERDAARYQRRAQVLWHEKIARPRFAKDMETVVDQLAEEARRGT